MAKTFLKNNALVLAIYAVLLVIALWFVFSYDKVAVHVYLNQFVGNKFLNFFFFYITYLGDGLVAPLILMVILIYNVRMGLYTTFSFLSATLFSQLLKRCFFDDINRPFFVFSYYHKYPITYVDGVEQYIHNSFPSGHSTQAFSIFMGLAFLTKNPLLKILFFCIALLTALSRVYLSQHWLTDITAGSMIGVFFSAALYYIFISKNKFEKLNKPLSAFRKA